MFKLFYISESNRIFYEAYTNTSDICPHNLLWASDFSECESLSYKHLNYRGLGSHKAKSWWWCWTIWLHFYNRSIKMETSEGSTLHTFRVSETAYEISLLCDYQGWSQLLNSDSGCIHDWWFERKSLWKVFWLLPYFLGLIFWRWHLQRQTLNDSEEWPAKEFWK